MDIRAPEQLYNPYRIFSREQWAELRNDTPMTLEPGEFSRLRSMHDRLDLKEVEAVMHPTQPREFAGLQRQERKSTRPNYSHLISPYARLSCRKNTATSLN